MEAKPTENAAVGSKQQVKDLLAHMDPMIYLAGTADNTSEMLMYLADMDPSFHKLQLVKSLRRGMREDLSSAIEEHVDKYLQEQKGKMHAENPVDYLVDEVLADCKYENFVRDTKSSLESSISKISDNFDDEIVTGMFGNDDDDPTYSVSPNESNESSLNSSLNQSGLMFLHPAQYDNIAENLMTKRDYESRNDALNILISVTPSEPVMQDGWADIRRGLRDCLLDECGDIFDKSLKVHCRLLTSQVHNAVKEAYLNLLDAVAGFYFSKHHVAKIPVQGEKIHLKTCEGMIRILKVLIEFQNEFPLIWIRYPERFVDDMIEATISLLALQPPGRDLQLVTVLDMYSVMDPEASWLKRWLHGHWGRTKTFIAMRSNSLVLLNSVSFCIKYLESCTLTTHTEPIGDILSAGLVSHLQFTHSINLILAVMSFLDGRKLFPVNVPSKDELVTSQGILQMLIKAVNSNTSKVITSQISDLLCKFCSQDEAKCSVICDAGIVEILLQGVSRLEDGQAKQENSEVRGSCTYMRAVLHLLDTITSTHVGQRYILLGRKRKPSSRSGLSGTSSSMASEVLDLILFLMRCRHAASDLKRLGISICSSLLSSPIGIHVCIDHPFIESFLGHLKERSQAASQARLTDDEDERACEPFTLSVPQSVPLLTTLLLSFRGVFLLEGEGVLFLAMSRVMPELIRKGDLNPRILAHLCSSHQGCSLLSGHNVICPLWDTVIQVVKGEELTQGRPLLQEEKEEAMGVALTPLLTLLSTFQGTRLIFSRESLLEPLSEALFSASELQSDLHTIAQQLLVSSTSVPDSVAFLQSSLAYQEQLLAQQMQMRVVEGEAIAVDENSILRNHILVKSFLIGGSGERLLPPHTLNDALPSNTPVLFSQYPPPRDYIPEKPIRSMHKKQNEVWRFLSDTRHGLHDVGWLNHCRKAVCSVLKSGEEIKSWLVMDLIDRTVRVLLSNPEELLPGCHIPQPPSPGTPHSLASPTVYSKGWSFSSASTPSPIGQENLQNLNRNRSSDLQELPEYHSVAIELVLRYGSELQLLIASGSLRENLMDVLKYTQSNILLDAYDKCDWFTMALFLVYGGSYDRCVSALTNVGVLLTGAVLWPSLADSLSHSFEILPGEMVLGGIIHNVQLILSIEIPALYMALQASDACLWSVLGEWVRCVFLGVLPWTEVCHYLVLVLLLGPDFTIYFLVALVKHLQGPITRQARSHKAVLHLQTSVIRGWRAGEQMGFMEALCRRHRRTVLPALLRPLSTQRHHHTPRQL
ncbi:protein broad-minded-like [Eriocheir sinensis]|uniref:protein broad-minded-like n=1 Tax=Eriocheir sinensis TaxID=95602 RepID=UPI0021C92E16|nr:protein broad-minded-like [Eriocheir sinensis]